jgi:hypothetical protein
MSDCEYLQWELNRYKEDERQRRDKERERYEKRQQEREERYEYNLRTADTWPEALRNQRCLFNREVKNELEADRKWGIVNPAPDPYFQDGADACSRALDLWKEIAPTKEERRSNLKTQIAQLQEMLEAINDEIATEVGTQLLQEQNGTETKRLDGWRMIAHSMIDGVESFNNWLDW